MGPLQTMGLRHQETNAKDDEIQRLRHELEDAQNFMESIIVSFR